MLGDVRSGSKNNTLLPFSTASLEISTANVNNNRETITSSRDILALITELLATHWDGLTCNFLRTNQTPWKLPRPT